jgi:hypothetical protein
LAYDVNTGVQVFTLPDGLFSADGLHYFALTTTSQPALESYSVTTGKLLYTLPLAGVWALDFVSADGQYVVLSQQAQDKQQLTALILEGATGTEKQRVALDRNMAIDGLSADAHALYLIDYLPAANPDHYQVRVYDLVAKSLLPDALVDKREADEVMAGERWESVSSKGGLWLLSLYLRMQENEAFVHALDMNDRYAFCIDLPAGGGDLTQQKFNTLALSPQNATLYIANAVTGTVSEASLSDFSVKRTTTFKGQSTTTDPDTQLARSLLTPDGRTLYFTSGQDVWAFDTASRKVSGPFASNGPISGFGLNPTGDRLLVAKMDGSLVALDTISGIAVSLR